MGPAIPVEELLEAASSVFHSRAWEEEGRRTQGEKTGPVHGCLAGAEADDATDRGTWKYSYQHLL